MSDRELQVIIGRLGTPYTLGRAIEFLVEGNVDQAIGLLTGKRDVTDKTPVKTAPDRTAAKPEKKQKENSAKKTRRCTECGITKGITGFPAGEKVCRECGRFRKGRASSLKEAEEIGNE